MTHLTAGEAGVGHPAYHLWGLRCCTLSAGGVGGWAGEEKWGWLGEVLAMLVAGMAAGLGPLAALLYLMLRRFLRLLDVLLIARVICKLVGCVFSDNCPAVLGTVGDPYELLALHYERPTLLECILGSLEGRGRRRACFAQVLRCLRDSLVHLAVE